MKIEDVMTRRVVAARADTDLAHVARLMWDNDCGAVPVVDAEDKVVGILTDRDVCMGAHFGGKALRELRAASCMAGEVATCRASESATAVAKRMGEKKVRRVPVTDDAGHLVGLVSIGDLLNAAARASSKERKDIHGALVAALGIICERPAPEEVAPIVPTKRRVAAPKVAKSSAKKRARV